MNTNHVHPNAQIDPSTEIGPYVIVEDDVIVGKHCKIMPHAILHSGTRLGDHCRIFPGAVLGGVPQDLKFNGEYSTLEIGHHTTIREYATLNRGTADRGKTVVGNHVLCMAYSHVAHDCDIADHVILSNSVNIAGHVDIGEYAILSGLVAVHQFSKIGKHAFIGGGALVRRDVPPYIKAAREPLSYLGVNSVGLERRGFSAQTIRELNDIYRILFVNNLNLSQATKELRLIYQNNPMADEILEFIQSSSRGIIKGIRYLEE